MPTGLVQLGAGLLLLSAVSQRHLLRQGGVVLHALPRPPLLTYERLSHSRLCVCVCLRVRAVETFCSPALPSAQTKAGRSVKSSCRARRRISSRSTRPATARGRSVSISPSCQSIAYTHTHTILYSVICSFLSLFKCLSLFPSFSVILILLFFLTLLYCLCLFTP